MDWKITQKNRFRLAKEKWYINKPVNRDVYFALCYPNTYSIGMSNLGFTTIFAALNNSGFFTAERFFLPDKEDLPLYKNGEQCLLSQDGERPFSSFDAVGFSISFELDFINVLRVLEMGHVRPLREERTEENPIIIGGGIGVTANPEPLAPYFDLFVIGEAEEILYKMGEIIQQGKKERWLKQDIISALGQLEGIYLPSKKKETTRLCVKNLDNYPANSPLITPDTAFSSMFLVELFRGCCHRCPFCLVSHCYLLRYRSLDEIAKQVKKGLSLTDRIGLIGAAVSDYPEIDSLCELILENGGKISVSSLRADTVSYYTLLALARSGQKMLTIAPEAGSEQLRKKLKQNLTNEHIEQVFFQSKKIGFSKIKLYFMVGLPSEKDEDVQAITALVKGLQKKYGLSISLSINPFVPKAHTPFQWSAMDSLANLQRKGKFLKESLKGFALVFESPQLALQQAVIARGDQNLGYRLPKMGKRDYLLTTDSYLKEKSKSAQLPWDFLQMKEERDFLWEEKLRLS